MARRDKHPKTKPVVVRWIDSMGTSGWNNLDKPTDMECTSVGHLIKKTKDRVTIAMNRSHYGNGDYMEIPMIAVKSIRKLKE